MLNIEPIKLLSGSHNDTAKTGSGCFMNVIAYLNGEPQITDQSPCVCATIRKIAIWLNDYMKDSERHMLLSFVQRAMGTATDDRDVMNRRLDEVVSLANDMALYAAGSAGSAAGSAEYAAEYAAEAAGYAAEAARYAAKYAAGYAEAARSVAKYARYAAESAGCAARSAGYAAEYAAECTLMRKNIIERILKFMDAACPPADVPSQILIDRANELIRIAQEA